jgi:hypothetical protein
MALNCGQILSANFREFCIGQQEFEHNLKQLSLRASFIGEAIFSLASWGLPHSTSFRSQ